MLLSVWRKRLWLALPLILIDRWLLVMM
jgi:hypothetical protein